MGTKHTPGPWVANDQHSGSEIWRIESDGGVYANDGYIIASLFGPDAKANARLMAAAPELLDLVRDMVAEVVDYATINNLGDPEKQHNVKWARALIAKATGEK